MTSDWGEPFPDEYGLEILQVNYLSAGRKMRASGQWRCQSILPKIGFKTDDDLFGQNSASGRQELGMSSV